MHFLFNKTCQKIFFSTAVLERAFLKSIKESVDKNDFFYDIGIFNNIFIYVYIKNIYYF